MTTTTYYNLNIVEGTDIVNPLIVDNPNYEKIDEAMHNSAVAGVTLATEIANATVHAITRENSDCAVIRFIATSEWKAGDTATVDGVPVTALLPSGETLPDGAYVINANVLCILTGTNLTIYAERKKAENANEIAYNNTTVGAELVRLDGEIVRLDNEIDNVNSNLNQLLTCEIGCSRNNTATSDNIREIKLNGSYVSMEAFICTFTYMEYPQNYWIENLSFTAPNTVKFKTISTNGAASAKMDVNFVFKGIKQVNHS